MKKVFTLLASAALALGFTASAHAAVISLSDAGITTSSVSGTTVVDFNDYTTGPYSVIAGGNYAIVTGSVANFYAEPAGIDSPYLTVPTNGPNGDVTFGLGTTANYFGLFWGSIDAYNSISFYLNGAEVASFTGSDIVVPADGNQTSDATNRYVNFDFGTMTFNEIKFASNGYAFESDNHAFALVSVPEPSALILLGLGMIGLGVARRRQRNS